MENKVYGQNYVIKGQMSFDGIGRGEFYDFCFSVANAEKEAVDMMVAESNDDAMDSLKRSALVALCCENPLMISDIMEDILTQSTDYEYHDLDIGDYLSACAADDFGEEFLVYNFLEIESLEIYWNEYQMIERKIYNKELSASDINNIKQIACVLYNCGYHEIDTDLITIESAELIEDASAKTVSGVFTWDD